MNHKKALFFIEHRLQVFTMGGLYKDSLAREENYKFSNNIDNK